MAVAKPLKLDITNGSSKQMSATDTIPIANLATGTPDGTKFIRDDGTLQTVATSPKSPATKMFNHLNY